MESCPPLREKQEYKDIVFSILQKQFKHGHPQILNLETGDWSVESGEQSAKDRASSPRLLQIQEP
jgi:hypothetical protein